MPGAVPVKKFKLAYLRENIENGELYVQYISLGVVITAGVAWFGIIIWAFISNSESLSNLLLAAALGSVTIAVGYLLLKWILELIFLPGDIVAPVRDATDSVN